LRFLSTDASSKRQADSSSYSSSPSPSSLRHLIRPFLLKCHPDAVQNYPDAKSVNLVAIQTLNAFVDTMEEVMTGSTQAHKQKQEDWPRSVAIEFILPIPDPMIGRQKKPRPPTLSRRRVELIVPSWQLRQRVLTAAATSTPINHNILDEYGMFRNQSNDNDPSQLLVRFQWMVQRELAKLVRTAGLPIPKDFVPAWSQSAAHLEQDALRDYLLDKEDSLDDEDDGAQRPAFGQRRRFDASSYGPRRRRQVVRHPPTKRERNRDFFMARVNWKRQEEAYQEALRGMQEDIITAGLIADDPTRKQKFVDQVLSRVRVQRKEPRSSSVTGSDKKEDAKETNKEEEEEDEYELVPVLEQLIALRRLSLLLFDNFEELELEDMGKVWEEMVIILMAPRTYNTSTSATHRRRRRKQQPEDITNGFMFSYDTNNRVTVHMPVDFTDDELLEEFKSNLSDFSEMLNQQRKAEIFPADTFHSTE
jgi:hypothetical protein